MSSKSIKFKATVVSSGNATAVEVPQDVMRALGPEGRPPIVITIGGYSWRSRIAAMRGLKLIGISAAHRAAAGISEGDTIEVNVAKDEASREVREPSDLKTALDQIPEARDAFHRLPFGLKQKHVKGIEDAKSQQVRERRISKLISSLLAIITDI